MQIHHGYRRDNHAHGRGYFSRYDGGASGGRTRKTGVAALALLRRIGDGSRSEMTVPGIQPRDCFGRNRPANGNP